MAIYDAELTRFLKPGRAGSKAMYRNKDLCVISSTVINSYDHWRWFLSFFFLFAFIVSDILGGMVAAAMGSFAIKGKGRQHQHTYTHTT